MIKLQVPLKYEDLTIKFENLGTKLAYFTKYVVNLKSIAFDKFSHCYVIEQGLAQLISEHETICFRFWIAAMDSVWTYFRYQTFNIEQDWTKNDSKCSVWSDLWFAIKLQELVSVCLTLMWCEIEPIKFWYQTFNLFDTEPKIFRSCHNLREPGSISWISNQIVDDSIGFAGSVYNTMFNMAAVYFISSKVQGVN